jgi:hypothetical protein
MGIVILFRPFLGESQIAIGYLMSMGPQNMDAGGISTCSEVYVTTKDICNESML